MKNLVETIKNGGLVAVPTETVYGLACNGLDPEAVDKVYKIKGRPEVKPLSLMVHDVSWIERFCYDIPTVAYTFANIYWPGPVTIILKSKDFIPSIVRAGGLTIGLRCPDNDLTLNLIKCADLPLAAPSANPSGKPSAKNSEQVYEYFRDDIEILDGGECSLGVESTILDLSDVPYRILREGAVSGDEINKVFIDSLNVIGITGQSGSGKSLALNALTSNDYKLIDCDLVYHELLESDIDLISELKEAFPSAFSDSTLNRKELSSIVFNDCSALALLNEITHKYIVKKVRSILLDFALNGGKYAAIEAVELFSSGLDAFCKKTIGIVSDDEIRIKRIMERDTISYSQAYDRINAQKSADYYIDNCNAVIYNNDNPEQFLKIFLKEVEFNG